MPLAPMPSPHSSSPVGPCAFLFIDLETSQLDPTIDGACVLEIAWIAVDAELRQITEFSALVRPCEGMTLSGWSRDNLDPRLTQPAHLGDTRHTWAVTVRKVAYILSAMGAAPYRIAGWSPQFDLRWLAREAWLAPLLSHKIWDVSTLRGLDRMWSPILPTSPLPPSPHRALADCRSALAYLRAWRAANYQPL